MRHSGTIRWSAAVFLLLSPAALGAMPPQDDESAREIGRTTEKELKITLSSSFGTVYISRGEPEKILLMQSGEGENVNRDVAVNYAVRNRIGYLDITLGKRGHDGEPDKGGFHIDNLDGGTWYIRLSDAIPISFDLELGVGKGDFDLSGLNVKDFNLSAGASEVTLTFDKPNKTLVDNINIETGVSKFNGQSLCNANFKHFRFQGGVGASTLDFSGGLSREVDVDLEVGLGVMNIVVPRAIGAKVFYDKSWLSKVECDRDFQSSGQDQYTSDNFYEAPGKMNIRIDTGLGSIRIRRN